MTPTFPHETSRVIKRINRDWRLLIFDKQEINSSEKSESDDESETDDTKKSQKE